MYGLIGCTNCTVHYTHGWDRPPHRRITLEHMLQLLLKYLCTHFMQGEHGEAAGDLYSQTRHGDMPHAVPNPDDPNYSHFKEVLL